VNWLRPSNGRPRGLDAAPRDGTPILAYLRHGEWRQVYWNLFEGAWRAGDESFSDADVLGWLPLPPWPG
jgi:hypothetical protein